MVTDHVVTLQSHIAATAKKLGQEVVDKATALAKGAKPELPATRVVVALTADAPDGRFRLRLWDEYGRNPTDPAENRLNDENRDKLRFHGSLARTDIVLVPHDGFDGGTLTWVVRLQASGPAQSYTVRLTVIQIEPGKETPSGDFVYSGPLDDVEEITGRFHFKVTP